MYGSLIGNVIGILYFLIYQILGLLAAECCFKKERRMFRILFGSIIGNFSLQWFPFIMAFFMGFTKSSNIAALILYALIVCGVVVYFQKKAKKTGEPLFTVEKINWKEEVFTNRIFWLVIPTFVFFCILLNSHTLLSRDGAMWTGQCTYGDMNLHLSFITSIANQKTFPPEYSILPGTKLSYPFLCDSISSSIYVFGSSLRIAYILPMIFAILQAFFGFYLLAEVWLKDKAKSCVAWILFFFNGGFGFVYFMNGLVRDPSIFKNIFTEFYTTPTNYVQQNVRWVNVIADMLLPQRSTLFGWAVLFGILALIYRAVEKKKTSYFVIAGILGGGLPLIHTHSFMALGLICMVWVLADFYFMVNKEENIGEKRNVLGKYIVIIGMILMSVLQYLPGFQNSIETSGMMFALIIAGVVCIVICYYFYQVIYNGKLNTVLRTWGIFLLIVLVCAVPQLTNWTFKQASNGNFVKGLFNWSNEGDLYLWFYLKNIGLMMILTIPSVIYSKKKNFLTVLPAFFIWAITEVVVFQPNIYDNNKLLFAAYGLLCCIVADFVMNVSRKIRPLEKTGSIVFVAFILIICSISAVITLGREYHSEYELYSASQVKVCEYIEENTKEDDIILTNTRVNNAINSLTGRSIVCGSSTFLYYHGLDYEDREIAVNEMYNNPAGTTELLKQYHVSYILVGDDERASYPAMDESIFQSMYECVYNQDGVSLYKVQSSTP